MTVGLYTSRHYFDEKKQAVEEALQKMDVHAEIVFGELLKEGAEAKQTFGFEELFTKTKKYAAQMVAQQNVDIAIGVENALSYLYSADEWYYVICVALQAKKGRSAATFSQGIGVPLWMVKEVQEKDIKIDALTQRLSGENDPVAYFSNKKLTRKDLLMPSLLLAFAELNRPDQQAEMPMPVPIRQ